MMLDIKEMNRVVKSTGSGVLRKWRDFSLIIMLTLLIACNLHAAEAADPAAFQSSGSFYINDDVSNRRLFLFLEAGPLIARGTYSTYFFSRIGLTFVFVPQVLELDVSAGGALTLVDKPFTSFVMASSLLNLRVNRFRLGAGIGLSSKVKEGTWDDKGQELQQPWDFGVDVIAGIGFDLFYKSLRPSRSFIVFQLRAPVARQLNIGRHHIFLLGFRYDF